MNFELENLVFPLVQKHQINTLKYFYIISRNTESRNNHLGAVCSSRNKNRDSANYPPTYPPSPASCFLNYNFIKSKLENIIFSATVLRLPFILQLIFFLLFLYNNLKFANFTAKNTNGERRFLDSFNLRCLVGIWNS